MAVVALPLNSSLKFWPSGDSARYFYHLLEPIRDIMSYQYPPPPQEDNVMEPGPSGYMPNYSGQHQPSSGAELRLSPNSGHSTIERRDSYSDSTVLRKSISTSAMRSPQTLEQQSQLPISRDSFEQNALNVAAAEKRRNKLGYHRTSVACGKYWHAK